VEPTFVEEVNLLHAQMCQGIADPTRILILYLLADTPRYVSELAEALDIKQPTISHHLKILRERGLVSTTREGNAIRYEIRDDRIIEALDLLRAVMTDTLAEQAKLVNTITQQSA
jgi:ArsR family transcriptional regulator